MPIPTLEQLHAVGALQQPNYNDTTKYPSVLKQLRSMPPLVFAGECDKLRGRLAQVARGEAFLLQGGDCAETFAEVNAENIRNKLHVLLSMAIILTYAASVPVVKVGRMAGQYAKPRSSDTENRGSVTLPAYRGDAVNGFEFTASARAHDPQRLLHAYHASSATLNLVRAFTKGGDADLRQMHRWNTNFIRNTPSGRRYDRLNSAIDRALTFMDVIGIKSEEFSTVDLYSSHEALLLEYEHAMTRIDTRTELPYDVSGHFVWIGERTRQIDGAHVELLSKINNPIGVKLGATITADDAIRLYEKLNPDRQLGRVTFITRFGSDKIRDLLPPLIEKVTSAGIDVGWVCDPMHGNTFKANNGYKTRDFDKIIDEVSGFFDVHRSLGTWPGGLHIEFTGEDVTECVGGDGQIRADDLTHRYETMCDPRLNRAQSVELAFLVAEMLSLEGK